jgi:SAM-dependent methyltransferase
MAAQQDGGGVAEDRDRWHRWLLDVRFGGDAGEQKQQFARYLHPVRDAVLDHARLSPGDTLLDVGTGDGLIAFGALDRLAPAGRVIFSDVSAGLLGHCRELATAAGLAGRERYVRMSGNPLLPPLHEAMAQTLSPAEAAEFTTYLRPLVESGTGQERRAAAYLSAATPA